MLGGSKFAFWLFSKVPSFHSIRHHRQDTLVSTSKSDLENITLLSRSQDKLTVWELWPQHYSTADVFCANAALTLQCQQCFEFPAVCFTDCSRGGCPTSRGHQTFLWQWFPFPGFVARTCMLRCSTVPSGVLSIPHCTVCVRYYLTSHKADTALHIERSLKPISSTLFESQLYWRALVRYHTFHSQPDLIITILSVGSI